MASWIWSPKALAAQLNMPKKSSASSTRAISIPSNAGVLCSGMLVCPRAVNDDVRKYWYFNICQVAGPEVRKVAHVC